MVTVLLMNYKREQNLPEIIDRLSNQTVKCNIFLWNNSEKPFFDDRIDFIINSSNNVKCWARWSMAAFAKTPYIMSHDDDLCFTSNDAIERLIACHQKYNEPGMAIGFNGVKLGDDLSYYPSEKQKKIRKVGLTIGAKHVKYPLTDKRVDIVKGRMIFCKTDELKKVPLTAEFQEDCDDIIVSSFLAAGERKKHLVTNKLNSRIKELSGGTSIDAISQKKDWQDYRTMVTRQYFKG